MKKLRYVFAALAATFMTVFPLAACNSRESKDDELGHFQNESQPEAPQEPEVDIGGGNDYEEQVPPEEQTQPEVEVAPPDKGNEKPDEGKNPDEDDKKPNTVTYFTVTAEGVNIRSGAGTGYAVRGQAEKSTLYCLSEDAGGWYKTEYRNKTAYVSSKYCTLVNMPSSGNELIEAVIEEGCKLLGTPYVYGATRLHDGRGNFYKSFTTDEFDCSSLMQYIFYKGANKLIDVNTRTQVYQGTTVTAAQLKRGDLMFFTNAQRKNNKGVERIGHVALYLGDNYILHTASDYAKIEQISSTRWGYFIQAQRII